MAFWQWPAMIYAWFFTLYAIPNVIYANTSKIHVLQIGGSQELNEESLSLFTLLEPKLGEVLTGIHKL